MAADYPYFKFYAGEWISGSIALEDYEVQGVYINACAYYWGRGGNVSEQLLYKRFKNVREHIDTLIECELILIKRGRAKIKFLDEQLKTRETKAEQSRINGRKGGRPKNSLKKTQEKPSRLFLETQPKPKKTQYRGEESREEENREDKNIPPKPPTGGERKRFVKPSLEEVRVYCEDRGNIVNAENFYDWCLQNGWKLSNGNQMKDWRAAIRTWEKRSNDGGLFDGE